MIRHLIHEVLHELDIKPKKRKYKHKYKGKHHYKPSRKYGYRYDADHDDRYRSQYHDDDEWPRRGHSHRPGLIGALMRLAEGEIPYRHRSEYRHRGYRRRHERWDD